jgi:Secretion system C-terminal sorting domain
MKKFLIALFAMPVFIIYSHAASITWIGPSGSNWNNMANWSPGSVPGAADDVVFNTSVTVQMDIIPVIAPFIYLVNSLRVTGNATVTLSLTQAGGGTRVLQIKSLSTSAQGLKIDIGSTLTINAANAAGTLTYILDLTGAAGVTSEISGNLYFTGSGAGMGDAYLKLYTSGTNYANVTVKSSGIIKYFTNSGNTGSAAGIYLTMESGATYEINKNGGSLPYGNWDDNSNILITGATTNGNVFFSQLRYGNLRWESPAMSAATQMISNLSPVTAISLNNFTVANTNGRELRLKTGASAAVYDYTIRGKLDISAAAIVAISGITVTAGGARLHVMGHLVNAGVLKSDGAAGTVNELELNGVANQDISNTGTLSGTQLIFIVNNPAGATLLTALVISGTTPASLQLNNGKIKTASNKLLTMLDNSNYTGGSSASFIDGPMKKIGDDESFSFPVGKGDIYAPISFYSPGMSVTDAFQAEYFRVNPQTTYGINYQTPPFNHISYVEYWQLDKISGSTAIPANVTLTVTPYSFAKDINVTYVARYNSPDLQWKNTGVALRSPGPPSPPYITGSIMSSPVTQFGIFTLASSEPEAINPLPINLISFDAVKISDNKSKIIWALADYASVNVKFDIEQSFNGNRFTGFETVNGDSSNRSYTIYHDHPAHVRIRYRLKITNADGTTSYSKVVLLRDDINGWNIVFSPNPVSGNGIISISSSVSANLNIIIHDITGRVIRRMNQLVGAAAFQVPVNTEQMKNGIYFISVTDGKAKVVIRFIKL